MGDLRGLELGPSPSRSICGLVQPSAASLAPRPRMKNAKIVAASLAPRISMELRAGLSLESPK
jgi:hypothetical protein